MSDGTLKYVTKRNNSSGDDNMLNYVYSMESITFHFTEKPLAFPKMLGIPVGIPSHTLKNLFHKFSREKKHVSGDDNHD